MCKEVTSRVAALISSIALAITKARRRSVKIQIFITGGTFDKEYNEKTGELFFQDSHVEEMLTLGRSLVDVSLEQLMMVDSLFINNKHRKDIAKSCVASTCDQIVITHGTDTMVETGLVIDEMLAVAVEEATTKEEIEAIVRKTVVLTGAMIPYKFGSSDGLFNLGSALAFVQALPPGVYVSMNGRYFPIHNVRKNRKLGVFEYIQLEEE